MLFNKFEWNIVSFMSSNNNKLSNNETESGNQSQSEDQDFILIRAYIDGDEAAFEKLLMLHKDKVRNLIFLTLGDSEFVDDIMYTHKKKNYDSALLFTKMAIDVATLPRVEGYRYNETGLNTVTDELDEHINTPIDPDNPIERIEWDMKYRKLQGRFTKLLIADHRARFGRYALMA